MIYILIMSYAYLVICMYVLCRIMACSRSFTVFLKFIYISIYIYILMSLYSVVYIYVIYIYMYIYIYIYVLFFNVLSSHNHVHAYIMS
jgi:hypothetical protein